MASIEELEQQVEELRARLDAVSKGGELKMKSHGFRIGNLRIFQREVTSGDDRLYQEEPDGTQTDLTTAGSGGTRIQDADADTKVQVEEATDEDKIRMDTGGTERAVLDSTALDLTVPLKTDTINEHTATAGVTIEASGGAGQGAWIVDNKIYPRKDITDAYLSVAATGDLYWVGDATDTDIFFFDESADAWQFHIGGVKKFEVDGANTKIVSYYNHDFSAGIDVTGDITATGAVEPAGDTTAGDNSALGYTATEGAILTGQGSTSDVTIKNDADATVVSIPTGTTIAAFAGQLRIDSEPDADHTVSGITGIFTANENQAIGDVCYIDANGEMHLGDADAIATSKIVGMCADATISADASGNYLLWGVARDDTWTWTVGGAVYLTVTGTTTNTLSQTAPSGTDDCVVIVGVATHADRILFNPSVQAIVEHV